jgi:hypothetical protein
VTVAAVLVQSQESVELVPEETVDGLNANVQFALELP